MLTLHTHTHVDSGYSTEANDVFILQKKCLHIFNPILFFRICERRESETVIRNNNDTRDRRDVGYGLHKINFNWFICTCVDYELEAVGFLSRGHFQQKCRKRFRSIRHVLSLNFPLPGALLSGTLAFLFQNVHLDHRRGESLNYLESLLVLCCEHQKRNLMRI